MKQQLYRVWWKGQLLGVDLWQNHPEHLEENLFLSPSGRVFWRSHQGIEDITADCRVEIVAAPPTEKQVAFLTRSGVDVPTSKDQAAAAIERIITP